MFANLTIKSVELSNKIIYSFIFQLKNYLY